MCLSVFVVHPFLCVFTLGWSWETDRVVSAGGVTPCRHDDGCWRSLCPAHWRRPSDVGKGVESPAAAEALKAKVFSPGEPGVDVNRKGSLGDILVPSVMEKVMAVRENDAFPCETSTRQLCANRDVHLLANVFAIINVPSSEYMPANPARGGEMGTAIPSPSVCGDAELVFRGSGRHRARNGDQDTLSERQENP